MNLSDTIAAISTPPGRGAIGIIRLSGGSALDIASRFIRFPSSLPARRPTLTRLLDKAGNTVDEVVVTFFASPGSYTGDDVIEISCHGSTAILKFGLEEAVSYGARLAEPGEFTLRAFTNGKMDLPQAEAVRDLIDSTTLYQARVAAQQKQGALSRRLAPIKQGLVDLIALLEAGIDFAEDDVSVAPPEEIDRRIGNVLAGVQKLAASYSWGKLVTEGFSIAIAGPPNAGKSSLFNALLRQDRAIVTPIPGTTRDTVSEVLEIGGIPCSLIDTAGIRDTKDTIEFMGIERSFEAIADASITLFVVDATAPDYAVYQEKISGRAGAKGLCLFIANKCDLPHGNLPSGVFGVSALTGNGIERLREEIVNMLSEGGERFEEGFVTSLRQKKLLDEASSMLEKAMKAIRGQTPHEMVLLDLYCALEPMDSISGKTSADDILKQIFSTFCIGK